MKEFLTYYLIAGVLSSIWIHNNYEYMLNIFNEKQIYGIEKLPKIAFTIAAFIIGFIVFPFIAIGEFFEWRNK